MIPIVLQEEFSRHSDIISFRKLAEMNACGLRNVSHVCNYRHESYERGSWKKVDDNAIVIAAALIY